MFTSTPFGFDQVKKKQINQQNFHVEVTTEQHLNNDCNSKYVNYKMSIIKKSM